MATKDIQTTNKQHAVPQNIMDVEFKIVGDLTMRQFSYILINGVVAYAIYLTIDTFIIKWPLILIVVGFAITLAFIPIEERWLDEWIVNFFRAVYKDNQKIWRKEPILPSAFSYENLTHVVKQEMITLAPTTSRRKLEDYLDSYNKSNVETDPLDIDTSKYDMLLAQTYNKASANPTQTVNYNYPPAPQGNKEVPSQNNNFTNEELK